MLISYKWLQELIKLPRGVNAEDVAKRLSLSTVEVESMSRKGVDLENIVVGIITAVEPHPNADRLRVVRVDAGGKEPLTIVCGGSNVRVGQRVAVALVGARVRWHGEGELVELTPTAIRGVPSDGMICASTEIGLGEQYPLKNEKEILDVSFVNARAGTPLAQALGLDDTIYEIDNKSLSHRPDLWGYIGIAREISALCGAPLTVKEPPSMKSGKGIALSVSVQDKKLCPRYMAVAVRGVEAVASPAWMQTRLRASGVRPVNAIVDVTNYVMLEAGQPMHAFDYSAIKDAHGAVKLVVRSAKQKEEFTTLDGHKHTLHDKMLLIATPEKSLALAGVMGGDLSAITDTTHTIILESATFNPQSIRRTSHALALRTESSARFEKGLDTASAEWALRRAVELYKNIFPSAAVASAVVDAYAEKPHPRTIALDKETLKKKSGAHIALKDARAILRRLGFAVGVRGKALSVGVPSFRMRDIRDVEDIIEEIMRIYGYAHIPSLLPRVQMTAPNDASRVLTRALKTRWALENGFYEAYSYAFVRPQAIFALGGKLEEYYMLAHPLSDERPYVARALAANLLEAVEKNQHTHARVALFEMARVFLKKHSATGADDGAGGHLPHQPVHFASVYSEKREPHPFAYMKHCIESAFGAEGYVFDYRAPEKRESWWHARKAVEIYYHNKKVGYLAVLGRRAQAAFGIHNETAVVEIDWSLLEKETPQQVVYRAAWPFPAVTRDLALVMDESYSYADVAQTLTSEHQLVRGVELFDIYRGTRAGAGKKSLAFHITYQSKERTLTAQEADAAHKALVAKVIHTYKAEVR